MQYSTLWVSHYSTQKGTPIQSNTENKRSNPTTVVKFQRLTFKYRREWLIYDYSVLWFTGNASIVDVGSWRMCIKILPQQRACQLSTFMLQELLLHQSYDTWRKV